VELSVDSFPCIIEQFLLRDEAHLEGGCDGNTGGDVNPLPFGSGDPLYEMLQLVGTVLPAADAGEALQKRNCRHVGLGVSWRFDGVEFMRVVIINGSAQSSRIDQGVTRAVSQRVNEPLQLISFDLEGVGR